MGKNARLVYFFVPTRKTLSWAREWQKGPGRWPDDALGVDYHGRSRWLCSPCFNINLSVPSWRGKDASFQKLSGSCYVLVLWSPHMDALSATASKTPVFGILAYLFDPRYEEPLSHTSTHLNFLQHPVSYTIIKAAQKNAWGLFIQTSLHFRLFIFSNFSCFPDISWYFLGIF